MDKKIIAKVDDNSLGLPILETLVPNLKKCSWKKLFNPFPEKLSDIALIMKFARGIKYCFD